MKRKRSAGGRERERSRNVTTGDLSFSSCRDSSCVIKTGGVLLLLLEFLSGTNRRKSCEMT